MAQRYCKICKDFHDLEQAWPEACLGHYASKSARIGIQVIKDIEPYRSTITREVIGGRRQHRDHLRAHKCIELGNEMPKARPTSYVGNVGQDIKQAMEQLRAR